MTMPAGAAPGRESLPWPPAPHPARTFRGARWVQTIARTVHIAAMGTVLGGVAFEVPERALVTAISFTIASGLLLFGINLWKSGTYLYQGHGVAVLLKLALLGTGLLFPAARFECYLAATAVASIGSHMPKTWRHWSFLDHRVIE